MNKPAPKEPSMDEILSSIRQIIADDDAAVAPRKPAAGPGQAMPSPPPVRPVAVPASMPPPPKAPPPEPEPLALTPEQILREQAEADAGAVPGVSFNDILGAEDAAPEEVAEIVDQPPLVDPEDVTFDSDDGPDRPGTAYTAPAEQAAAVPPPPSTPPMQRPAASGVRIPPRAAPSVERAAPMPDPALSSDMAEQLLEPATEAAVKHAFTRLSGLSMSGANMTLEELVRDMLRPMLKEWLDENLPAMVERMVEKEIARISRGGE